ncbi:DNA invertase Pin-like site-specific DNA recombinase [Sphingobium wenxiniae]|uniref:Helix-turn-helix resolvase-like protein n=1 Tax=Sphingobium wenxiniae (strain DSM 21828 / CGMCC 1.7748 / JZ-1) TaxID=595605 RepID=A0A562K810_SPHWJ|nr:helix-turn-helix domain-containing protein [Sphingobium wenxiniae]MBB6193135.1 DNA invertase Pin-like site-specific DNA recombinase [Sphingobium wenxiniae]MBE5074976.1 Hin recombinase [Erythrobacteraceae bacterium E2-1 Yellow Sea]TWH91581.1 helix-turn-helix resolvase-like protein [Sphingobium wenxiniae]
MAKTVLFLAQTSHSPSIEEQRAFCEEDVDLIADAGTVSFVDLPKVLAAQGSALEPGDCIRVYDLTCLPIATTTLVRMLRKVLSNGIAVEFTKPGLVIEPDADSALFRFIALLDTHWRQVHGIKTHSREPKVGRKPRIAEAELPRIRAMLDEDGASVARVAKRLGVGRTTLFDYLQRHRKA